MPEYRLNDLIVRSHPDKQEIEISQGHIEDNHGSGVFITPLQITQLHALLDSAARELQEAQKHSC